MKVLITGGNGFVGSAVLSALLEDGHEVISLTRKIKISNDSESKRLSYIQSDLTDMQEIELEKLYGLDAVVHCAGELNDESKMYDLHVSGTENLLKIICEAASAQNRAIRWVQMSSVGAYGPERNRVERIIREDSPESPLGMYETTKTRSDELVRMASDRYEFFSYVILRPTNVFDRSMPNQSLHQLITMISNGKFMYISDKHCIVNYVDRRHVVEAAMSEIDQSELENHVSIVSNDCTVGELVNIVSEVTGKSRQYLTIPYCVAILIAALGKSLVHNFPLTVGRVRALAVRTVYIPSLNSRRHRSSSKTPTDDLRDYVRFVLG